MSPTHIRFRSVLPALLLAAGLMAATTAQAERTVTDMIGRSVTIPDHVGRVYAVGHCIPLVGAVAPEKLANNYRLPEAAKRFLDPSFYRDKIMPASGNRLSDEEIMRLAPDVVVMEKMAGIGDLAARLQARLKKPVLVVDEDLASFDASFRFLGEVLEAPQQAAAMQRFLHERLEPVVERARHIPAAQRVRVYYAEGTNGLSTNPSGSSHTQVLEYAGALNAADVANIPGEGMNSVSLEQLYLWRPDLILVWTPGADRLTTWKAIMENPLWQRLDAVARERVVQIPWLPFSWFDRPPGSNRILGVLWLAKLLYPETFDYDLVAVTQEYFRIFYHHALSAAEARELLALSRPQAAPAAQP